MAKTLVVVNPRAGNGRASKLWPQLEPLLREYFGAVDVIATTHPEQVKQELENVHARGTETIISVGGDGTNHALVNALATLQERHPTRSPIAYGMLPVGTGRDWARGLETPLENLRDSVRWLAQAQAKPTDAGLLLHDDAREYFLNIGSAGIGYEVARRVNELPVRYPWSFLQVTIQTLFTHRPRPMRILVDGEPWYDGPAYAVVIANGRFFAHGMKIAPGADTRDGLLDVILIEGASRTTVLTALPRVYTGSHLTHPNVRMTRARQIDVTSENQPLGVELDGEPVTGGELSFRVCPGLLRVLSHD